jgi:hypothetical protein
MKNRETMFGLRPELVKPSSMNANASGRTTSFPDTSENIAAKTPMLRSMFAK